MNYENLYFAFIESWKNQEFNDGVYTEKHHILPRYAGGDDSPENIIRLDYRQHTFAHKLLWKAYYKWQDKLAYSLMSGQIANEKLAVLRLIGQANVESGHLDRIRPMANNEKQRAWAKKLGEQHRESGFLDKIRLMRKNFKPSPESRRRRSIRDKERYKSPEMRGRLDKQRDTAIQVNISKSVDLANTVLQNAERNEEFLHKRSSRSKNLFVSPEGLEFDSPIYAAKYYGNIPAYTIENWCKRRMHGWCRRPKAPQE